MQQLTLTECKDKVTFQKTHRYFSMLLLHTLARFEAREVSDQGGEVVILSHRLEEIVY